MNHYLTIGQLAKRTGIANSALRFYETQGLLHPVKRTESGYRLYAPEAVQRVRFIQRAQHLGFSLADIQLLLNDDSRVAQIAEQRFIAIERQLTALLVQKHELTLFLQSTPDPHLTDERLISKIHVGTTLPTSERLTLDWLSERAGCVLSTPDAKALIDPLKGRHLHIWQEAEDYHILFTDDELHHHENAADVDGVRGAIEGLMRLELTCHQPLKMTLSPHPEGLLLSMSGAHAFMYAQLFLALEQSAPEK